MENKNEKYVLNREKKSGKIRWGRVIGTTFTLFVASSIVVVSASNFFKKKKYDYDPNYSNYSSQIESMMEVDIDSSIENDINKLQSVRIAIDEYNDADAFIEKSEKFNEIVENINLVINVGLDIEKKLHAKENGGHYEDFVIFQTGSDPSWYIKYNGEEDIKGSELFGKMRDLASSIGELQSYNTKEELKEVENPDKVVDKVNTVIRNIGMVVTNESVKK